jgi:dihydroxyacetone kinase-like protein
MFRGAIDEIRGHHSLLSELDSVGGDGDHGTTMNRAMASIEKVLDAAAPQTVEKLLNDVGWAILGVDGGAIGPLLGMFFVSMAAKLQEKTPVDNLDWAAVFKAGLAGVREQTQAQPGDKTLIDALLPAVDTLAEKLMDSLSPEEALHSSAVAAAEGAEQTATMQARFGRAKHIKEKSIGSRDPGATSVALLFRGFEKGLKDHA